MLYPARVRNRTLALALIACLVGACGAADEAPGRAEPPASASPPLEAARTTAPAEEPPAAKKSRPRGRPLPAFSGWTLDDQKLDVSQLIGKRLLVFFFNPEVREALPVSRAMNAIAGLRGRHNFEIVGVATGAERASAQDLAQREGLDFPIIDDSSAQIARRFGLRSPIALLGTDAEGYVTFGMGGFPTEDPRGIEEMLRKAMRLPGLDEAAGRPRAPDFSAEPIDRDESFALADHRGSPAVVIFFLHTCPHCHEALAFLKQTLAEMPEPQRPVIVGIELSGKTYSVRQQMREQGLDFLPVVFDRDGSIQAAYGVFGGVPDMFLIDRDGRIVARTQGWSPPKDEPLTRMRLARIAGTEIPMLLRTRGYSGNEACGVCHEAAYETWEFTTHASAYDTLVRHGSERDGECIGCHVVGYGEVGGFVDATETPELEDVGCETCHGRGGPHLSKDHVGRRDYSSLCVTCHDTKHSLGFDYAEFLPRVSHAANAHLLSLPPEEKRRVLAERGRPGGALLPTSARYVGSEACQSCHVPEFETWGASPHARSIDSLAAKGKTGEADCLSCHTTAFGRDGGFPVGGDVDAHADLARVGCESCHGPGGDHIGETAARFGTIVSLGDKCDSCVILQICGSCHDEANDPGFEFEVQEHIDRQRHGTTEPGTSRPKAPTAAAPGPGDRFAAAEEPGWSER
jgi:peroxiredoxin